MNNKYVVLQKEIIDLDSILYIGAITDTSFRMILKHYDQPITLIYATEEDKMSALKGLYVALGLDVEFTSDQNES